MKRLVSTRQRLAVIVTVIVLLGAGGGWMFVRARSTTARTTTPAMSDNRAWRAKVEHAIPVVTPPAATAAWRDGYQHFIVTLNPPTKTAPSKPAGGSGPDGAAGRWLRVSAPGQTAKLSDAQGRALLPWVRSFVVDSAGATWVQLADNAPASLGRASPGGAASSSVPGVDALRALPHTTVTHINGQRWAVRTKATRATIAHVPGVKKTAPDGLIPVSGSLANVSNDPLSDQQWYLQNRGDHYLVSPGDMTAGADADVPPAWAYTRGAGVTVAVVDTGMDVSNPDLANALWTNPDEPCGSVTDLDGDGYVGDCHGWDFGADNATGQLHPTVSSHGTAVSGIIAAGGGNGIGISGIAPDAKIMPLNVSAGGMYLSESGIEAAIQYAIDHHADIINLSLGGLGAIPTGMQSELDAAQAAGILVVAAAGNWGVDLDSTAVYPASASVTNNNVIAVGASNPDDTPASFSDYSPTAVQVFAPGNALMTTRLPSAYGRYALFSGTSAAAPVVAGEAALMKSLNPSLTPVQIIQSIESTTQPVPALAGYDVSGGRVDIAAAVRSVAGAASTIHYEFDGFNNLTGSTQNMNLQVTAEPSAIPAGDDTSLSVTLATRVSGQTMVVTNYPLSVTDPDGNQTTITTDAAGTATLTGVNASALDGSGGTFALTTALPDGLYGLATQLNDDTAGQPIGDVGRVVFEIDGSLAPTPTTAATTTTTSSGATTTTGAVTTTTSASTPTTASGVTTTTAVASTSTTNPNVTTTTGAATTSTTDPNATTTTDPNATTTTDAATTTTVAAPTTTDPNASSTTTAAATTTTTVPLPPPPDPPTGLTATPGDGSVTLSWTAPTGGVNGYRVYDDGNLVAQTSGLSITFMGLEDGQTYHFAVSSYSIYGESARTGTVPATPAAPTTTPATAPSTSAPAATTTTAAAAVTTSTTVPTPASPYHVTPSNGSVDGGTAITITGPDMPDDVGIFIGGASATDLVHVSPGEYTATTGSNVVPGTYDVQIIDNSGNIITIPGAFTYQSDSVASSTTTTPATTPVTTVPSAPTTSVAPPTTAAPATTVAPTTTPTTAPPSNGLTLSVAPPGGPMSDFPPGMWDGAVCRKSSC